MKLCRSGLAREWWCDVIAGIGAGGGGFSFATQAVDRGDQQISTIACPSASKFIAARPALPNTVCKRRLVTLPHVTQSNWGGGPNLDTMSTKPVDTVKPNVFPGCRGIRGGGAPPTGKPGTPIGENGDHGLCRGNVVPGLRTRIMRATAISARTFPHIHTCLLENGSDCAFRHVFRVIGEGGIKDAWQG